MHALYRQWMNVVDVHNKLRQGVVSMADVWHTRSWAERHFAEGLGMWEVNVYKALVYFYPAWKSLAHGEFRARLAWALLTLGKEPYPADVMRDTDTHTGGSSGADPGPSPLVGSPGGSNRRAPLPGGQHEYQKVPGSSGRTCAYCGKSHGAYQFCMTCKGLGLGLIYVCGRKSGRPCMDDHVAGKPLLHSSFKMSDEARIRVGNARRARATGDEEADDEDDEVDGEEAHTSPPARPARKRRA
uniref:PiggyBac transposable element-derived protein domain-containing protein n=1 Tax=Coccolithus braarudii TaxID=221442 RepID=A0A7S0Q7T1_9EUKA|mmetsp:Transcript_9621/g.20991  ORF Transcript_9621/g.20991 Transcript_9621/m.20991 type:complete len:242 (+) Transcript_9621:225-950(+)